MEDPAVLEKKGVELFRELLRVYASAELEDYYFAGQWKDQLMRTDLQLVCQHRKEAGAPEPKPLEEVEMPKMPAGPGVYGLQTGLQAGLQNGMMRPALQPGVILAASVPVVSNMSGPIAELRMIALFVAKWKIDPAKTKMALAKLTPSRRRHVVENFSTALTGADASQALDEYIRECGDTNAWADTEAAAEADVTMTEEKAAAKRPAPVGALAEAVKRPRLAQAVTPAEATARIAAARAAALNPKGTAPAEDEEKPKIAVAKPKAAAAKPAAKPAAPKAASQSKIVAAVAPSKMVSASALTASNLLSKPEDTYTWTKKGIDMGKSPEAEFFENMAIPAVGSTVSKSCMGKFKERGIEVSSLIKEGYMTKAVTRSSSAPAMSSSAGTSTAVARPVGSPVQELQLIAAFVSQWKLDPARTKMMLAKLTPSRRRFVMESFDCPHGPGKAATDALDSYTKHCTATNAWDKAPSASSTASASLKAARPAGPASGMRGSVAARPVSVGLAATSTPRPTGPTSGMRGSLAARPATAGLGATSTPRPTGPTSGMRGSLAARPAQAIGLASKPGFRPSTPGSTLVRPAGLTTARSYSAPPPGRPAVRPPAARPAVRGSYGAAAPYPSAVGGGSWSAPSARPGQKW